MAIRSLLYKDHIDIIDYIHIMIPTVGEILEDEENYYNIVFSITASPIDMMVQLDDIGIDFAQLSEGLAKGFTGCRVHECSLCER